MSHDGRLTTKDLQKGASQAQIDYVMRGVVSRERIAVSVGYADYADPALDPESWLNDHDTEPEQCECDICGEPESWDTIERTDIGFLCQECVSACACVNCLEFFPPGLLEPVSDAYGVSKYCFKCFVDYIEMEID